MILDVEKFIRRRRADWNEFEGMLTQLEAGDRRTFDVENAQRFYYLYECIAADLTKLSAYAVEPHTKQYLESLVARGFGEMHGTVSRRLPFAQAFLTFLAAFPITVRRHFKALIWVFVIFGGGAIFGAGALGLDPSSKSVLMPFSHLQGDPSDRVAEEEAREGKNMEDGKSTFSTYLMTHNTKVSIMTLALGMTFGIGTSIFLFYNGAILGAVMMDYVLAGETVFLTGWLLPHGSVEIPAILLAGQGGLILGSTLLFAKNRMSLGERLRSIRGDLVVLISGIAVLLVWAGIIESFFSQYHEPVLPYSVKIAFGALQLAGVFAYFMFAGRKQEGLLK
ncbi:MAG: stage II sporulation protein M [Opitutaceae bacterium]